MRKFQYFPIKNINIFKRNAFSQHLCVMLSAYICVALYEGVLRDRDTPQVTSTQTN